MEKQIIIYTDGSSLGNPGRGGWAAILLFENMRKELSEGYEHTTNNRMELMAVINALKALKTNKFKIDLFTDSRLIVDSINKGWLESWKKNNWKKSNKTLVLNIDLWEELDHILKNYKVNFRWVEAHIGNKENERCDFLCKQAAQSSNLKIDIKYLENIKNE